MTQNSKNYWNELILKLPNVCLIPFDRAYKTLLSCQKKHLWFNIFSAWNFFFLKFTSALLIFQLKIYFFIQEKKNLQKFENFEMV